MYKLRMEKEKAANGVLECDTPEKLFKHFQAAFYIHSGPQDILDGVERLELAMKIGSKPHSSVLDLYTAQRERALAPYDAARAFEEQYPDQKVDVSSETVPAEKLRWALSVLGSDVTKKCASSLDDASRVQSEISHLNVRIKTIAQEKTAWIIEETEKAKKDTEIFSFTNRYLDEIDERTLLLINRPSPDSAQYTDFTLALKNLEEKIEADKVELSILNRRLSARIDEEADLLFEKTASAIETEYASLQKELADAETVIFTAVTDRLLATSEISEEQATAWAENNIFISDSGTNKLRRIGYQPAQLKKDVAELYRYVGGKLGPIEFIVEGKSKRAFSRGKTTIALQGNFCKKTLFHECGHLIEHIDQAFSVACKSFIEQRASGSPVSLKKLTGASYASSEAAYPDSFIHPYVGKIYEDAATEVVSMGLQCLSSPQALAELARRDSGHFKLIMGICKRKNPFTEMYLEHSLEVTTEQINERTRMSSWEKELSRVCGGEFGKKLAFASVPDGQWGYKGYWVDVRGRSSLLYTVQMNNGKTKARTIGVGNIHNIRSMAYLLIAKDEGLLFQELPAGEESQQKIIWTIRDRKVPDWFTETTKLPKV